MRELAKSLVKASMPRAGAKLLQRLSHLVNGVPPPGSSQSGHLGTLEALKAMRARGFVPQKIIDGGAFHGIWTDHVRGIFPDASVLMVEAQPGKRPILEAAAAKHGGMAQVAIALLGPEDGKEMRFAEMETGSSVFEENSEIPRTIRTLETQRLDTVAAEAGFGDAAFIKLDLQGFELEALKGAPDLLRTAEALLLEVAFLPVNQGAPLAHEAFAFLAERGFVAYEIGDAIRRPLDQALWQADLIFVKREHPLRGDSRFA